MKLPSHPPVKPAPRVPRNEPLFSLGDGVGDPPDPLSRGERILRLIIVGIAAMVVSVAIAFSVRRLAEAAPIAVPPAATIPVEFSCPAPARGGDVTSITFTHDGKTIVTRCQLTRDWQLLNPRGQNIPKPEGK